MVRLYFKKLLTMLIYIVFFFLIYYVSYIFLSPIANFFHNPIMRYGVLLGIPAIIIFAIVCNRRIQRPALKDSFLTAVNSNPTFKTDVMFVFKSSFLHAEVLSFATIILPFLISIGVESNASLWRDIFAGAVILFISVGFFFILDVISWVIVCFFWRIEMRM